MDRIGPGGIFELLTDGRMDKSGDFTPGCGMSPARAACVMEFFNTPKGLSNKQVLDRCKNWFSVMTMPEEQFKEFYDLLKEAGLITPEDEAFAADPVAIREFYGTKTEKPTWR